MINAKKNYDFEVQHDSFSQQPEFRRATVVYISGGLACGIAPYPRKYFLYTPPEGS